MRAGIGANGALAVHEGMSLGRDSLSAAAIVIALMILFCGGVIYLRAFVIALVERTDVGSAGITLRIGLAGRLGGRGMSTAVSAVCADAVTVVFMLTSVSAVNAGAVLIAVILLLDRSAAAGICTLMSLFGGGVIYLSAVVVVRVLASVRRTAISAYRGSLTGSLLGVGGMNAGVRAYGALTVLEGMSLGCDSLSAAAIVIALMILLGGSIIYRGAFMITRILISVFFTALITGRLRLTGRLSAAV